MTILPELFFSIEIYTYIYKSGLKMTHCFYTVPLRWVSKRKGNCSKATHVGGTCGPHQHRGKSWGLSSGCSWCRGHWAPRLCTQNVQATTGKEKLTPKFATKTVRLPLSDVPHVLNNLRRSHDDPKAKDIPKFSCMQKFSKPLGRVETRGRWRYITYYIYNILIVLIFKKKRKLRHTDAI